MKPTKKTKLAKKGKKKFYFSRNKKKEIKLDKKKPKWIISVKNIPGSLCKTRIFQFCADFGDITKITIDKQSPSSMEDLFGEQQIKRAKINFSQITDSSFLSETKILEGNDLQIKTIARYEENSSKVFVGNLKKNAEISELELHTAIEELGKVIKLDLVCVANTKKSKGYAFVTFKEKESAELAINGPSLYFQERDLQFQRAKEDIIIIEDQDLAKEWAEGSEWHSTAMSLSNDILLSQEEVNTNSSSTKPQINQTLHNFRYGPPLIEKMLDDNDEDYDYF